MDSHFSLKTNNNILAFCGTNGRTYAATTMSALQADVT
jgi:hypothetical protein